MYEEHYEHCSKVQGIDEQESSGNATINKTSELVHLENFIAQTKDSKCREEKMNVVHKGYDRFLMACIGATMKASL